MLYLLQDYIGQSGFDRLVQQYNAVQRRDNNLPTSAHKKVFAQFLIQLTPKEAQSKFQKIDAWLVLTFYTLSRAGTYTSDWVGQVATTLRWECRWAAPETHREIRQSRTATLVWGKLGIWNSFWWKSRWHWKAWQRFCIGKWATASRVGQHSIAFVNGPSHPYKSPSSQ